MDNLYRYVLCISQSGGCIQCVFNNFLGKDCINFLVTLDQFPLEKNEYKLNTTPSLSHFVYYRLLFACIYMVKLHRYMLCISQSGGLYSTCIQ